MPYFWFQIKKVYFYHCDYLANYHFPQRGMKTVVTEQPQTSDKIVLESVVDTDKAFDSSKEWPFAQFCEDLCHDLFEYLFHSHIGFIQTIPQSKGAWN